MTVSFFNMAYQELAYQKYFNQGRKDLEHNQPQFFLVTVNPDNDLFDDALALAQDVVPSMDGFFRKRKGSQLGFQVLSHPQENLAVVVWKSQSEQKAYLALATNGREIVVSDPCFIPTNSGQGLDIGIAQRADSIQGLSSSGSWAVKALVWLNRKVNQLETSLTAEQIAGTIKARISNQAKQRRIHF